MLKVLIVDDEERIRKGLQTIIDWNSYGYEVCGIADNGRNGINEVKRLQPDLVVVDIKMPGIDGLTMIRNLRNEGIHCYYIILTGFKEFDYAREAIELEVNSFLIKPVNETQLVEKITKLASVIKEKNKLIQNMDAMERLENQSLLENILNCDYKVDMINRLLVNHNYDFLWNSYQCLLFVTNDNLVVNYIEIFIHNHGLGLAFNKDKLGVIAIVKNSDMTKKTYLLQTLLDNIEKLLAVNISIYIGKLVLERNEIKSSYDECIDMSINHFIYSNRAIVHNEEKMCSLQYNTREKLIDDMLAYMALGNMLGIRESMQSYGCMLASKKKREDYIKLDYAGMLANIIHSLFSKNKVNMTFDLNEMIHRIHYSKTLLELNEEMVSMFIAFSREQNNDSEYIVNKVIEYISENYRDAIKLNTIAKACHYSTPYLGKLFKKTRDMSFNSYLDKVRIDKGKDLLKEGNKVSVVTKMVGYNNPDYFADKFKSHVGMTPIEYRNLSNKD